MQNLLLGDCFATSGGLWVLTPSVASVYPIAVRLPHYFFIIRICISCLCCLGAGPLVQRALVDVVALMVEQGALPEASLPVWRDWALTVMGDSGKEGGLRTACADALSGGWAKPCKWHGWTYALCGA